MSAVKYNTVAKVLLEKLSRPKEKLFLHLFHRFRLPALRQCLDQLSSPSNVIKELATVQVYNFCFKLDNIDHKETISKEFFDKFTWPVAVYLFVIAFPVTLSSEPEHTVTPRRFLVGISGPAGSGKSLNSALLAHFINALDTLQKNSRKKDINGDKRAVCTTISMDGYHHSNKYLANHTDSNGTLLSTIKGRPATFNVNKLKFDIERLRNGHSVVEVPVYDRQIHDAIQGAQVVKKSHHLILFEGLFMGCYTQGSNKLWKSIAANLDVKIFLQIPKKMMEGRLLRRKILQSSKTPAEISQHIKRVDAITHHELIQAALKMAHFIFTFKQQIASASLELQTLSTQHPASFTISTLIPQKEIDRVACNTINLPASIQNHILVVGLNPALQQTWQFTEMIKMGEVNRASNITHSIGGKGQQVAHALVHFQRVFPVQVSLCQFLGGSTGSRLAQMLNQFHDTIRQITVQTKSCTRSCHTLLKDGGEATELIEPSSHVSTEELKAMISAVNTELELCNRFDAVVIAGTVPVGVTGNFYAKVAKMVGEVTILDGYKFIDEVLATGRVRILKINRTEFLKIIAKTCNISIETRMFEIRSTHVKRVFEMYQLKWIAVTAGGNGSLLYSCDGTQLQFSLPELPIGKVVNPIGAGDTVTAVLSAGLVHGLDMQNAFAIALAAGTASCLKVKGSKYDIDDVKNILSGMVIRNLHFLDALRSPASSL